jgi:hypothetical protein
MEDAAGWLTEEHLIAETGIGTFSLDRWRREGLVPPHSDYDSLAVSG